MNEDLRCNGVEWTQYYNVFQRNFGIDHSTIVIMIVLALKAIDLRLRHLFTISQVEPPYTSV